MKSLGLFFIFLGEFVTPVEAEVHIKNHAPKPAPAKAGGGFRN